MPASIRKKSKRMTCRKKYKIIRKVKEHHRKVRRELKKNPPKHSKPKDPGVPNSLPFKEEILQEAEQRKQRAQALKEVQKANRQKLQSQNRGLGEMIEEATRKDKKNYKKAEKKEVIPLKEIILDYETSSSDLKKLVETADIILEVLDARDPQGCRCPQLEDLVLNSNKKLVLVVNKIDLIPRSILEEWLKFFRQSTPTVAFKASTPVLLTKPSKTKSAAKHKVEGLKTPGHCFGGNFLMKTLRNYCSSLGDQDSLKVAVVGFPGVGKQSIIKSLSGSGASSGSVEILEKPGVVLSSDSSAVVQAFRNMVRVESLKDVIAPAEAIIQRANHTQLCLHYTVPDFSSCDELLCLLAKRMGKYKKGGIPNAEEGAKRLINDWNRGIIKFYTRPPQISNEELNIANKESDLPIDIHEEEQELQKAPEMFASKGVEVAPSSPTDWASLNQENDAMEVENNEEEEKKEIVEVKKSKKCKKTK